jgi:hypothetical protein
MAPPFDPGAAQVSDTCESLGTATSDPGAFGADNGVTEVDTPENALVPTAFTAATRNTYAVPFTKSVTVEDVAVETGRVNEVHVTPASALY